MRKMRTTQTSLFDPETVDHPVAELLERASAWLDGHRNWRRWSPRTWEPGTVRAGRTV